MHVSAAGRPYVNHENNFNRNCQMFSKRAQPIDSMRSNNVTNTQQQKRFHFEKSEVPRTTYLSTRNSFEHYKNTKNQKFNDHITSDGTNAFRKGAGVEYQQSQEKRVARINLPDFHGTSSRTTRRTSREITSTKARFKKIYCDIYDMSMSYFQFKIRDD